MCSARARETGSGAKGTKGSNFLSSTGVAVWIFNLFGKASHATSVCSSRLSRAEYKLDCLSTASGTFSDGIIGQTGRQVKGEEGRDLFFS